MKPDEGRLQTAEHILALILENELTNGGITVGISKFKEDSGLLEITCNLDPRTLGLSGLEEKVNAVIAKNLQVNKFVLKREDAEKEVDLRKVPLSVQEVRIIDIQGFDKRPCRDPHVDNTSEIGHFKILSLDKVGANRYRFVFQVE